MALPLPRREPHDERHDRHLPGDTMRSARSALQLRALHAGRGRRSAAARRADARGLDARQGLSSPPRDHRARRDDGDLAERRRDEPHGHAEGDAFDSGYLAPGGSFSYTFAKQGHYAYQCLIHKFMKGTVDVFSLVLTGPEEPVAPAGRSSSRASRRPGPQRDARRVGGGEPRRTVKARPDGSFTVRFRGDRARAPTAPRRARPRARSSRSGSSRASRVTRTGDDGPRRDRARAAGARVALQAYDRDHFTWRTVAHTPPRHPLAGTAGDPGRARPGPRRRSRRGRLGRRGVAGDRARRSILI